MNWKKWISIAAAVCLAVTAVPMRAVAQEELVQEKMLIHFFQFILPLLHALLRTTAKPPYHPQKFHL